MDHGATLSPETELEGLTSQEAALRLKAEGPNELPAAIKRSLAQRSWDVIREPMLLLLLVAGVVNFLLSKVGVAPVSWQTDSNLSLATVVVAAVWGSLAFNMLLFMAALRNIPRSYYEAAEIDGASGWRQFWSISLPLLRPTSFMVVLLSSIGAMKEFALVQALNGGGPGNTNYLMVQYIYHTGFELNKVGYASAASFILMLMLLVIALIQVRIDRRTELG